MTNLGECENGGQSEAAAVNARVERRASANVV
jgi:hypothetical protein